MNPTFTVSIDTEKRKASAAGLVAVGEKVDVVVTGLDVTQIPEWEQDNDEGFSGPSLRFRLVAPDGKDLVRFPLAEGDAWTIGAEGELTAEVDFNTMPLRHWFHGYEIGAKAEVGIILDSIVDAMEYGRGTVKVLQWTASPAEDPTILPDWRKTLRDLNAAIVEIKDSVDLAEGFANDAEASAGVATEKAGVAETAANNALSSASAAEGFKSDAQNAANDALDYKDDAETAADTATTKAEEAADSAGDAAQILEDIEEAIAGKAEQSDLEAEVTRATQKEDELEDGLTEANDAISDNADAIDQLEESKADKTALDTLSDAIDSEAETREEKDAAICAKLNQEIGNRQSAIHNLNFAIQQEAYRAQVVEAGLVSMVSEKADKSDTYTKTEVDTKIAGVQTFQKYLVNELPDADEADMKGLYLVPTGETTEEGNLCEEWTVVEEDGEKRWEHIGGTVVDLDNYYTKSEVDGKLDEKQAKLYTQGEPGWTFSTESTGAEIEAFMANAANYSVTEEQSGSAWLYTLTGYDEENYYVTPVGRTAQSTSIPFYVLDVTQTSMYGSVLAEYSSAQTDIPAQVDTTPTANSGRLITSGAVHEATADAVKYVADKDGNKTAVTIGSRADGEVGRKSLSVGENNFVRHRALSIGKNNIVWDQGFACGQDNTVGSAAGESSFAAGEDNVVPTYCSGAIGRNLQTSNDYEVAICRYNVSRNGSGAAADTRFSVGIGSAGGRRNAFEVMQSGTVYVLGVGGYEGTAAGAMGEDLATVISAILNGAVLNALGYEYSAWDMSAFPSTFQSSQPQTYHNEVTDKYEWIILTGGVVVSDEKYDTEADALAALSITLRGPQLSDGAVATRTRTATSYRLGPVDGPNADKPLQPALSDAQLANIAAVPGKLDKSGGAADDLLICGTSEAIKFDDDVLYLYSKINGTWVVQHVWDLRTSQDGIVAFTADIPYDRITITTSQLQDHAVQKVTLNAATTTLTLPALTDLTGKVSDFGIDMVNGYAPSDTPTAASFSLAGTIGTDYNIIVPEGEDWSEMSALAAGEMAQFYFTLSAFAINGKPTWKIVKQVVELVPVPSAP